MVESVEESYKKSKQEKKRMWNDGRQGSTTQCVYVMAQLEQHCKKKKAATETNIQHDLL